MSGWDADPSVVEPGFDPPPKTALVTGGARRLGKAIVERLVSDGWAVAIHYGRSRDEADAMAEAIRDGGGCAVAVGADLGAEAEVAEIVPAAVEALGPLGLLVNNASVFERDTAADGTRESWDLHMEANLRAPALLSKDFVRHVPASNRGSIVNIIDQRVWNPTPGFMSYTLSKMGLWDLTRLMALDLAPRIRVNGVGPGPTMPSPRQDVAEFRRQAEMVLLERSVRPREIADTVAWLAQAVSVTGQMIAVDGGQHLQWPPMTDGVPED